MLSAIVPVNSTVSCSTTATWARSCSRSSQRTSMPSMRTEPSVTSIIRISSEAIADFPDPEGPTRATR